MLMRLFVAMTLCFCLCGCVERTLTINTKPQGAHVYINDEDAGVAPVTVDFRWYGDYNVQCRKEGYAPLKTHRKLEAPWYDYFPMDFFAQVLYPGTIKDHTDWTFQLEPQTSIDRETLIQQAQTLRDELNDPNFISSN